jgi:hypothetical protein
VDGAAFKAECSVYGMKYRVQGEAYGCLRGSKLQNDVVLRRLPRNRSSKSNQGDGCEAQTGMKAIDGVHPDKIPSDRNMTYSFRLPILQRSRVKRG